MQALAAKGQKAEALRYAESCREPLGERPRRSTRTCEEILLSSGLIDEAYARYGVRANRGGTYLATFRAVAKKYPHKAARRDPRRSREDHARRRGQVVRGGEGRGPLRRGARAREPHAVRSQRRSRAPRATTPRSSPASRSAPGCSALSWLVQGYGYEITSVDVWDAYRATLLAADRLGSRRRREGACSEDGRRGARWRALRDQGARQRARAVTRKRAPGGGIAVRSKRRSTDPRFLGRWRISEMKLWAADFIDLEVPGQVTFADEQGGEFQFLGGHLKSGQAWTGQNRPVGRRDRVTSTS